MPCPKTRAVTQKMQLAGHQNEGKDEKLKKGSQMALRTYVSHEEMGARGRNVRG